MATDTYTLEYVARIEKLQAELAKIPGATDRSALAAAQRLEARLDKASRQAGKAVDANIGGALKRLAQGAGYGDVAEKLSNLGQGLVALGPAALAAAGAVAGVGIAVGSIAGAGAAADFLWDAAKATGKLDGEARALDNAMRDLKLTIGDDVAPTLETMAVLVVAGTLAVSDATKAFLKARTAAIDWYDGLSGVSKGLAALVLPGIAASSAARDLTKSIEDGALAENDYIKRAKDMVGEADKQNEADKRKTATRRDHTSALQDEIAALKARDPWMEKAVELDEREAKALADVDVGIRETSAALAEGQALRESEAMAWAEIVDGLRTTRQKSIEAAKASREAWVSTTGDIAGSVGTVLGLLAEQEGVSKRTAKALVIAQKAAGIAQVGISTAVAIMQALASFGPAGPAIAAGYAATGIAQAAVIAATPLPSFHQGGQMQADEGLAVVRKGERVVTERAARDYDQGLGDANRGAATGGGPVRVSFEGRDLDVMLARVVRQHGAVRRELDRRRMTGAY